MIGWGQVFYGAALTSVIAAAVLTFVKRERNPRVLAPAIAAAFLGPLSWNSVLQRAALETDAFFVDIPFKPFPVSWQDTGSGVFTLAVASLFVGVAFRREPAGRVLGITAVVALIAFLVDIYLY